MKKQEKEGENKVKDMAVIITMAGHGSRFREAGYNLPKYMIQAKGKTLFEWSMDSFLDYNSHVYKYIFVVRKEDNASGFILNKCAQYRLKDISIIELDSMTDGQATTCMFAMPECKEDNPIMVYNIDTYVEPYELKYADIKGEGYIPCFQAEGTHWSFVKINNFGDVIEVREKQRISNHCTIGAYYFASAQLYQNIYCEYYKSEEHLEKNEKYIAPLYNWMIRKGFKVQMDDIGREKVHVLGTPQELEEFAGESTNEEK